VSVRTIKFLHSVSSRSSGFKDESHRKVWLWGVFEPQFGNAALASFTWSPAQRAPQQQSGLCLAESRAPALEGKRHLNRDKGTTHPPAKFKLQKQQQTCLSHLDSLRKPSCSRGAAAADARALTTAKSAILKAAIGTCSTTRAMALGATLRGFFWMTAPVLGSSSARSLRTTAGRLMLLKSGMRWQG
jgi:hypothetical protein